MTTDCRVDAAEANLLALPLLLSDRVRPFMFCGRSYVHTSAVPLTYMAVTPGLRSLIGEFSRPRRLSDFIGTEVSRSTIRFFGMLLRTGILLQPSSPDPVHALCSSPHWQRCLQLFPTTLCNLRCIYCHAASDPQVGLRMSRIQALRAVDTFFDSLQENGKSVRLSFHGGGEPTTHFAVMTAAWQRFRERARERGLRPSVSTITNGMFDARVLHTLLQPEWRVAVSYDGPLQGVQRPTVNGRKSCARVVANLRALRAAGKYVLMRATITRSGVNTLRDLVDDAVEVGIHHVQVEGASTLGRGADLIDGSPDPTAFAEAFLDAFAYALGRGVRLSTSAWTHARVGDGRYCAAETGARAFTPDRFLSACSETGSGVCRDNPFLVGRSRADGFPEIWPERESRLQSRTGYNLPECRHCSLVDTCAGGCASKAYAQAGDLLACDEKHCIMSKIINPRLMADIADGRLLPDAGWQPMEATLDGSDPRLPAISGRIVALVPPFARSRWNSSPDRRPLFPPPQDAPLFFHLP